MILSANDVAKMMDLSCVKTFTTLDDIKNLLSAAKSYDFGQVSVLQCYVDLCKETLKDRKDIRVMGNVSFPSGSDITALKVIQAEQIIAAGCDEMDMVMNVGLLLSGEYELVKEDVAAVVKCVAGRVPLKVIIEVGYLNDEQIVKASEICLEAGADYVKTGTGWAAPTTVEHVKLIKGVVGDRMKIKASGGVRTLDEFAEMVRAGASRIGVNLKSGISIVEECRQRGSIEV